MKMRRLGRPGACTVSTNFLSKLFIAASLILAADIPAQAQEEAFMYAPITSPILSASLSIDVAGLTADEYVGGTQVNWAQLWDPTTMTALDLSSALFGNTSFPATPAINLAPNETGVFSAAINPTFFNTLAGGMVGLTAGLTDTGDGWFAIDNIALNITTTAGTQSFYYPSAPNGFGMGIPTGGNLPGPVQTVLPYTGTGFDEPISGKAIDVVTAVPEPGTMALLASGAAFLIARKRKAIGILAILMAAGLAAQAQPTKLDENLITKHVETEVPASVDESGHEFVPGEVLVVFKKNLSDADKKALFKRHRLELIAEHKYAGVHHLRILPGKSVAETVRQLRNEPGVESACPNYVRAPKDNPNLPVPNDPLYPQQWHLNNNGRQTQRVPSVLHADPNGNNMYDNGEAVYLDLDNSGTVTAGDIRYVAAAGSGLGTGRVQAGDGDIGTALIPFNANEGFTDVNSSINPYVSLTGRYNGDDGIYRTLSTTGVVSPGDMRLEPTFGYAGAAAAAGVVAAGDPDVGLKLEKFPSAIVDADIDAPQGWAFGTDCSTNVVAIIDTGMDVTHEDLMGNLWIGPGPINGQSFSGNERHTLTAGSSFVAAGQGIYLDDDNSRTVTAGDTRIVPAPGAPAAGPVNAGDADLTTRLGSFITGVTNGHEMHTENIVANGRYDVGEYIYNNLANNSVVTVGDIRLTPVPGTPGWGPANPVQAGDPDCRPARAILPFINNVAGGINELHPTAGAYANGTGIYNNIAGNGMVTAGDIRLVPPAGSGLPAGPVNGGNPAAVPPVPPDADVGTALFQFAANEGHDAQGGAGPRFVAGDGIYRDNDASKTITPGDTRITAAAGSGLASSSTVGVADADVTAVGLTAFFTGFYERHTVAGAFAAGDAIYLDRDDNGVVSRGDIRLTAVAGAGAAGTAVAAASIDVGRQLFDFTANPAGVECHDNVAAQSHATFFTGDGIYFNNAANGVVTAGDMRIVPAAGSGLAAGVVSAGNPAAVPPVPPDPDIGTRLYTFTLFELHNDVNSDGRYLSPEYVVNNRAENYQVSPGDQRMQASTYPAVGAPPAAAGAGSFVVAGDLDQGLPLITFYNRFARNELHADPNRDGRYNTGEAIYNNTAMNNRVTVGDTRLVPAAGSGLAAGTVMAGDADIGTALIPFAQHVQGNNISDPNGHGTGVAGVIGAVGNNGIGIAGVCWKARIMGLRTDYSDASDIACINWILAQKQAGVPVAIVNMSLGGASYSSALQTAMYNAMYNGSGMLFTVSAGNESNDNSPQGEPQECIYRAALLNGTLSVGDTRITGYGRPALGLGAGTQVRAGDEDFIGSVAANAIPAPRTPPPFLHAFLPIEKYVDANGNNQYDAGEVIYRVLDGSPVVSVNCIRLTMVAAVGGGVFYNVGLVQAGDFDIGQRLHSFAPNEMYHDIADDIGDAVHLKNYYDGTLTEFPASLNLDREISVAATDNADNLAGFSSWGTQNVHIAAPGVGIRTLKPGNQYQWINGTSFAAPLVAGILYHTWTRPGFYGTSSSQPDFVRRTMLYSDFNGGGGGAVVIAASHGYDHRYGVRKSVVFGNQDARVRIDTGDDFGDAPDSYRTTLPNWGARHEDMGDEWLGRDTALPLLWTFRYLPWYLPPPATGATPEYDATDNPLLWPPDPDGMQNILNNDAADNGIQFIGPLTFSTPGAPPNQATLRVFINTANNDVADGANGRYPILGANPLGFSYRTLGDGVHGPTDNRNLWVNAWFDWNQNGSFDDPGEHVFMLACNPTAWAAGPSPTHGGVYDVTFNMPVAPAGVPTNGQVWARFRLDYGENAGQSFAIQNPTLVHNIGPSPGGQISFWDDGPGGLGMPGNPVAERYESIPVQPYQDPVLDNARGLARYGEVEDYVVNVGNTNVPAEPDEYLLPDPDQIHVYGPVTNGFPAYVTMPLTAMVENQFVGLPGETVIFSSVLGNVQFASGETNSDGSESSVVTDPTGAALVAFYATQPGPAVIQAMVSSTGLSAFLFLQAQPAAPSMGIVSQVMLNRSVTLQLVGSPGQTYNIQRSTDLQTWTTITTVTTAAQSGVITFTDPNAPPDSAFYKAVATP